MWGYHPQQAGQGAGESPRSMSQGAKITPHRAPRREGSPASRQGHPWWVGSGAGAQDSCRGGHCHPGGSWPAPVPVPVPDRDRCALFVCNSHPATRHPEPCSGLPGASRAGAPSAVRTQTPGLCQNPLQSQVRRCCPKFRECPPPAAALRAGRSPEVPEHPGAAFPSREAGFAPRCPRLTVPFRASISQV